MSGINEKYEYCKKDFTKIKTFHALNFSPEP